MNTSLLRELEQNIQKARESLALGESLTRLQNNRDFRLVMTEGFFKQEAIRLVQLKSRPEMQTPELQRHVLLQIDAIGSLYQYFQSIENQAEQARKSLDADEQTREELLAEGSE